MRKYAKSIISMLLVTVMVLSLCTFSVSAESDRTDITDYQNYVAIGTSITNADSLPDGCDEKWTVGGYPYLVATEIGLDTSDTTNFLARNGYRTTEYRVLLEDDFYGDAFTRDYWGDSALKHKSDWGERYRNAVKNADIISIELGSNEIQGTFQFSAINFCKENDLHFYLNNEEVNVIEYSVAGYLTDVFDVIKENNLLDDFVSYIAKDMEEGIEQFYSDWDGLIEDVLKINQNGADIFVLGLYDPAETFAKQYVGGDYEGIVAFLMKQVLEPMMLKLRTYMAFGSKYASDYHFVNISDIPLEDTKDGVHPYYEGHQYLAEKLIAAIEKNLPCKHTHTKTFGAVKATKYSFGSTGSEICLDCGKIIKLAKIVKYTDTCTHEETKVIGAYNATKLTTGYTGTTVCKNCGKTIQKGETIPKTK